MTKCPKCGYCPHCDQPHTLCEYHKNNTVLSGHEESDAQDEKELSEESQRIDAILSGRSIEELLNDT